MIANKADSEASMDWSEVALGERWVVLVGGLPVARRLEWGGVRCQRDGTEGGSGLGRWMDGWLAGRRHTRLPAREWLDWLIDRLFRRSTGTLLVSNTNTLVVGWDGCRGSARPGQA